MSNGPFIDVLVEPNDNCPDGCTMRFKAEDEPRLVRRVRWFDDADVGIECEVEGWSSEGGGRAVPATAVTVEDSASGVAVLVWGGDWGVRLRPRDGGPAFGAPEGLLRISPEDVLE